MNFVMEDYSKKLVQVGLKTVQEDWNVLNTRTDQFEKR